MCILMCILIFFHSTCSGCGGSGCSGCRPCVVLQYVSGIIQWLIWQWFQFPFYVYRRSCVFMARCKYTQFQCSLVLGVKCTCSAWVPILLGLFMFHLQWKAWETVLHTARVLSMQPRTYTWYMMVCMFVHHFIGYYSLHVEFRCNICTKNIEAGKGWVSAITVFQL